MIIEMGVLYMIQRKRKAVSPLIAAVLLIAFTMVIAAILTAWVTTFTQDKRQDTDVYNEQMKCAGANFKADPLFAAYNRSSDAEETYLYAKLQNIGFESILISKVWVTFSEVSNPLQVDLPEAIISTDADLTNVSVGEDANDIIEAFILDKNDLKTFTINVTQLVTADDVYAMSTFKPPTSVKFDTDFCEGVWTELRKPVTGWKK